MKDEGIQRKQDQRKHRKSEYQLSPKHREALESNPIGNNFGDNAAIFHTIFENLRDAMGVSKAGEHILVNPAYLRLFGYSSEEELIQHSVSELVAPSMRAAVTEIIKRGIQGIAAPPFYESRGLRKDGSEFDMEVQVSFCELQGERYTLTIIRDITRHKHAEIALRESEELFRTSFENATAGVCLVGLNGMFLKPNCKTCEMFGYTNEEMTQLRFNDITYPEDRQLGLENLKMLISGEVSNATFEKRYIHKSGRIVWALVSTAVVRNPSGEPLYFVTYLTDITDRKHAEEKLTYDASHDGLTGLPNRALFLDRLEQAIQHEQQLKVNSFSVLFLDLDQFKVINDSLGHVLGDWLLVAIGHRLSDCLRVDDSVARLSGDEFVILAKTTGESDAVVAVADRIQEELKKPFFLEGHQVYISASIGIVQSLIGYEIASDVLRDADIAMYRAKTLGKARYEIFHNGLRAQAISRLEIENGLRQAVESHEFELHYQPILKLQSGQIIGFEALVRWRHPKHGLLSPAEFIRIAEESGLILPIGSWILLEACSQVKCWQELFPQYKNLTISINISGKQFAQTDFIDQIRQSLSQTDLDAKYLKLEITESVLIESFAMENTNFQKILDIGSQLQIDDFGTGYSSLRYLQHFPIHAVKIDKSFVQEIGIGQKTSEIIRSIISMAHDLDMETIAEGIETQDQLDQLKNFTCQFGQGYLFSRPLDSQTAEKFLSDFRPE